MNQRGRNQVNYWIWTRWTNFGIGHILPMPPRALDAADCLKKIATISRRGIFAEECSEILYDLSLNRRKSDWFLSINKFKLFVRINIVRKDYNL